MILCSRDKIRTKKNAVKNHKKIYKNLKKKGLTSPGSYGLIHIEEGIN